MTGLSNQLLSQLDGLPVPDESSCQHGMHHKAWKPFMHGMGDIVQDLERAGHGEGLRDRLKAAHEAVEADPQYANISQEDAWSGTNVRCRHDFWEARRTELRAVLNEIEND